MSKETNESEQFAFHILFPNMLSIIKYNPEPALTLKSLIIAAQIKIEVIARSKVKRCQDMGYSGYRDVGSVQKLVIKHASNGVRLRLIRRSGPLLENFTGLQFFYIPRLALHPSHPTRY